MMFGLGESGGIMGGLWITVSAFSAGIVFSVFVVVVVVVVEAVLVS